jgi:O-antigen/teichoic acid export membrane protein
MLYESLEDTESVAFSKELLKDKVISGGIWMHAMLFSKRGLDLILTIILAQLLSPETFGVIGVFYIVSSALESFTKTGFNKALVQNKDTNGEYMNTAWTVSVVRGFLLASMAFLSAPLLVNFLNTPEALGVVRVLSLSLVLKGLINTGIIHFLRELDFRKQFLWKITGFTINFLVSITLALILRNKWALVWGVLASNVADILFSFILHPFRPKLRFNPTIFKVLFNYGKWLLLSSILYFAISQLDKIFVTKFLGKFELGIYIIAMRFARIPEFASKEIPNILFPIYSKFQSNLEITKTLYLKALKVTHLFCIPLVGGIITLAGPFIHCFLGEKWILSKVPLQILTLGTGINILVSGSMALFNAMGKTNFVFKLHLAKLIIMSIVIYPLITRYGVLGVCLCYLSMALTGLLVWKVEINKLLNVRLRDMSCLIYPIIGTLCFSAVLYLTNSSSITSLISFAGVVMMCIVIYGLLALAVHKFTDFKILREVFEIFFAFLQKTKIKTSTI